MISDSVAHALSRTAPPANQSKAEQCWSSEAEVTALPTRLGCVQLGLIERSLLPPLEPRNRDSKWRHLVHSAAESTGFACHILS